MHWWCGHLIACADPSDGPIPVALALAAALRVVLVQGPVEGPALVADTARHVGLALTQLPWGHRTMERVGTTLIISFIWISKKYHQFM